MRTVLTAAAMLAVVACSDGGPASYSLTTPHAIAECEIAQPFEPIGTWDLSWGCEFRQEGTAENPCDPAEGPWLDADTMTAVATGIDTSRVTIGSIQVNAEFDQDGAANWFAPGQDNGMDRIAYYYGCPDGTAQFVGLWRIGTTGQTYAAWRAVATRR
ncbi:MAG: hypothetical protein IPJ61_20775 [Tessaracoccus sp.]|uniref:hypothetical protein n=1 Tax=Tessaracoccus sp. TaxID=1971211 RepID=UPI001EC12B5A|nr:hypothetical protein [Tessaracoccus sp.]MBK7823424.1 hypothetical protein [Tessaracoccus sp.]